MAQIKPCYGSGIGWVATVPIRPLAREPPYVPRLGGGALSFYPESNGEPSKCIHYPFTLLKEPFGCSARWIEG